MEVVKASLDRFEGGYAVIYSDSGEKYDLPQDIAKMKVGSRVLLYIEDGHVVRVEADEKETVGALDRIKDKYERLKKGKHLL